MRGLQKILKLLHITEKHEVDHPGDSDKKLHVASDDAALLNSFMPWTFRSSLTGKKNALELSTARFMGAMLSRI